MPYVAPPPVVGTTCAPRDPDVVDLAPSVAATRIVLDRDLSLLDRLNEDERRRLLVRVLCGLVAYQDEPAPARLAG